MQALTGTDSILSVGDGSELDLSMLSITSTAASKEERQQDLADITSSLLSIAGHMDQVLAALVL
jgi:hypothetical protein